MAASWKVLFSIGTLLGSTRVKFVKMERKLRIIIISINLCTDRSLLIHYLSLMAIIQSGSAYISMGSAILRRRCCIICLFGPHMSLKRRLSSIIDCLLFIHFCAMCSFQESFVSSTTPRYFTVGDGVIRIPPRTMCKSFKVLRSLVRVTGFL